MENKSIMGEMGEIAKKAHKLKGLSETKNFGAKHGARHKTAQAKALNKAQGKSTMPF